MTTYRWIGSSGGDFAVAQNWNPNTGFPGSADTALIGTGFVVTSDESNAVAHLALAAGSTLEVAAGTFSIGAGTATGGIAGVITVANDSALSLAGTIANTGSIQLNGYNGTTSLLLAGNTTLTGTGTIQLNDNSNDQITSSGGTFRLVNAGNTIAGSGQLGAGALILVNEAGGTIDANNGSNGLYLSPGAAGSLSNYGLIEATAAGSLYIEGTDMVQKTAGVTGIGTIEAAGGGDYVVLSGATVTGGALLTTILAGGTSFGTIETAGGSTDGLDGSTAAGAVTISGSVDVSNNSTLDLAGSIVNQGTIALLGYNGPTVLALTANVTLTGGGTVSLNDNGNNQVYGVNAGAPQTLDNVNDTLVGAGQLGAGQLSIVNAASGVIDAVGGTTLVIDTGANGSVKNAALIEATGSGGLQIAGTTVDNTQVVGGVTTDVGTVEANGSTVVLTDTGSGASFLATDIKGGTLISTGGGTIETAVGAIATLDGSGAATTIDGAAHVANSSTLNLLGSVVLNAASGGEISIDGYNAATVLLVNSSAVTLSGGGLVNMTDDGNTQITGAAASDTLVNAGDTIVGGGYLGIGSLSIDNRTGGVIDATGGNRLVVDTAGGTFSNEGLIEATANAGLQVAAGMTIANAGTLSSNGAPIYLDGATIRGGTLATPNGSFYVEGGNTTTLDGSTSAVTLAGAGTFQIDNSATADLLGSLVNQASLVIDGYNTATTLVVASPTVTLTGGGTVSLVDNGNSQLTGAAATDKLVNVNNLIAGGGYLGLASLSLDNQAGGTIDATGGNRLDVDLASFTNEGLVEATAGNGLEVYGGTTLANTGTVSANGAYVYLDDATVIGGTLAALSGNFDVEGGNTATLSGLTLTGTGTFEIINSATAYLVGSIDNQSTIFIEGYNTATDLVVASPTVTLTGGGTVSFGDDGNSDLLGASASDRLVNVNNTIVGGGYLGLGSLSLDNQAAGVIDATGGNRLIINLAGGSFANEGLIEATAGNGLEITNATTLANSGTLAAAGAVVYLDDATLVGGTLALTSNDAVVEGGNTATLSGLTLTGAGTFDIANAATADLLASLDNQSTIIIGGYNTPTDLVIASATVTLTGGGTVSFGDDGNSDLLGAKASDRLVNVDNTIVGGGYLGLGSLSLDNQAAGVIDATGSNRLDIDLAGGTFTNEGLIEATAGNGIELYGGTTLTNTGTVSANGANIFLDGGTIKGGTLATPGGGFYVEGGNTGALNGVTLTGAGGFTVDNTATGELLGVVTNDSTITVAGYNTATVLLIDAATVRLAGSGVVVLANSGTNSQIVGAAKTDKLVNAGNTIEGGGLLGGGSLLLDNQAAGVIDGDTGATLAIALSGAFTNEGTLEDTGGGGGVDVQTGTLTNTGSILADGGNVTIEAAVPVTNLSAGTLTGGTWGSYGGTLSVASGPVVTDAATVVLSGTSSIVSFGGTTIEASLVSIAAHGTLDVLGDRNYATSNTLSDSGLLLLGGGTLTTAGTLSVAAGATLAGSGVVTAPVASAGLLDASGGGTLALTGAVTGAGAIAADAGSVLQLNQAPIATLSGVATLNGAGSEIEFGTTSFTTIESSLTAIAAGGTLNVLGGRGYTTAGALSVAGLLQAGGGAFSFGSLGITAAGALDGFGSFAAAVASAGRVESAGGLLQLAGGLSGTGRVVVDAHSTLELGAASASGTATISGLLLLGGVTYAAAASTVEATGVVQGSGKLQGPVTLAGTIAAQGGLLTVSGAVGGGTGTLVADSGATLDLNGAVSAAKLTDDGSVQVDGATLAVTSLAVAAGASLALGGSTDTLTTATDSGTLTLAGASLTAGSLAIAHAGVLSGKGSVTGPLANAGTVKALGGVLDIGGTVTGVGKMSIGNGATLELGGASSEAVTFVAKAVGALDLAAPSSFAGAIGGLLRGDVIDLGGVLATNATVTDGVLQVTASNGGPFSFAVAGTGLKGSVFDISSDQHGGSLLTLTAAAVAAVGERSLQSEFVPAALQPSVGSASVTDAGPGGGASLYTPSVPQWFVAQGH